MNLAPFRNQLNRLKDIVEKMDQSKYLTSRDDEGNLIVKFADGDTLQLPVLPMRTYQIQAQKELFLKGIRRHWWMWTRRAGKEVQSWNLIIQGAIETPGLYDIIYPTNVRARDVIWDGMITMPDGSSLKFLEMIPERFILKINNADMKVYLINGAVIHAYGIDTNPNKPRGTNPRGIVIAEAAWVDPRVSGVILPILQQNKGWLIYQSTFDGMNHFYRMGLEIKEDANWFHSFHTCETCIDEHGERYVTEDMIKQDRKILPEWSILQEHYGIVQNNPESMYFSREMDIIHQTEAIQEGLMLYDTPVFGFWDIGVSDCTVVLLVQFDRNGNPIIIECIEDNNKNIHYYLEKSQHFCTRNGIYLSGHYAPHDGNKRDPGSGNNIDYQPQTFVGIAREAGHQFTVVERPKRKINAINAMRLLLTRTKFNKQNTDRLIECLSIYGKEFDEKNGIYKNVPHPKWATHTVDAYQTLTLALEAGLVQNNTAEIIYYNK